jgi:hypothetical protein
MTPTNEVYASKADQMEQAAELEPYEADEGCVHAAVSTEDGRTWHGVVEVMGVEVYAYESADRELACEMVNDALADIRDDVTAVWWRW